MDESFLAKNYVFLANILLKIMSLNIWGLFIKDCCVVYTLMFQLVCRSLEKIFILKANKILCNI